MEVKMVCRSYFQPNSIRETIDILARFRGNARIIAGGTDLVIELKTQKRKVEALVDISKVEGLSDIKIDGNMLHLGAMVTHTQASKSDVILKRTPVLAEACSTVGSPQIRNMGTLVGNIVNAMPAADGACALIALCGRLRIVGEDGHERLQPIEEVYKGPGESLIDSTREMVTEVEFPVPTAQSGSSFQRLSRRKALSLPVLNEAVWVCLDQGLKKFEDARIVIGPVSPLPFRAKNAENFLKGAMVTRDIVKKAALVASEESSPRTSIRGGKEYRQQMVSVLMERAVGQALSRIDPMFSNFMT